MLRLHFRPEFLNRIDDIVVFHPLTRENIRQIVEVQLKRLSKRLAEKHLEIELTDEARDLLAERGFDPAYGARPLRRTIQRMVLDPLALQILSGQIRDHSRVIISVEGKELAFHAFLSQAA
jgi:ATP-dependent Clp protease ATP-binding subunit ClpB